MVKLVRGSKKICLILQKPKRPSMAKKWKWARPSLQEEGLVKPRRPYRHHEPPLNLPSNQHIPDIIVDNLPVPTSPCVAWKKKRKTKKRKRQRACHRQCRKKCLSFVCLDITGIQFCTTNNIHEYSIGKLKNWTGLHISKWWKVIF